VKHIVLYHADCSDGFGAAWAAWKHLGNDASYMPMEYGTAPPSLHRNVHVYILDFTFPRDVIGDMHDHCKELVIIDHHGTTAKELEGLPYVVFDERKSGAVLAWEYFHPSAPIPELLRYIMDRDLWQFRLPQSREVFALWPPIQWTSRCGTTSNPPILPERVSLFSAIKEKSSGRSAIGPGSSLSPAIASRSSIRQFLRPTSDRSS